MTRDWVSCWTVPLSCVPHLSLAGLGLQQHVLPWLRNDKHSVAWPVVLVPGRLQFSALTFFVALGLLLCTLVWYRLLSHLPPTLP